MSKIIGKMKLDDGKEVIFRYPDAKDIKEVLRFYNKVITQTEFLARITPVTLKEEKKWFGGMLDKVKNKDAVYVLAEYNKKMIGSATVERKFEQTQKHVGVFGIAILREFRGKKVGTKMMQLLEQDAKKLKFEIIFLAVYGRNNVGQILYKKMGFVEAGKVPRGIKRGLDYDDDIFMYKVLK